MLEKSLTIIWIVFQYKPCFIESKANERFRWTSDSVSTLISFYNVAASGSGSSEHKMRGFLVGCDWAGSIEDL